MRGFSASPRDPSQSFTATPSPPWRKDNLSGACIRALRSSAQARIVSRSPSKRTSCSPRRPVGVTTTFSIKPRKAVAASVRQARIGERFGQPLDLAAV